MLYLQATVQVAPGKMEEFLEVFSNDYITETQRLGRKLVAQWQTVVGPRNEIIDIWAHDSFADLDRFYEARGKSEIMQKAISRIRPLIAWETTKILKPTQFSPLK